MAVCEACHREMTRAMGCKAAPIDNFKDGVVRAPVPFGQEKKWGELRMAPPDKCPDCGVMQKFVHHPGCDQEECPKCFKQFLGCDCLDDPESPTVKA